MFLQKVGIMRSFVSCCIIAGFQTLALLPQARAQLGQVLGNVVQAGLTHALNPNPLYRAYPPMQIPGPTPAPKVEDDAAKMEAASGDARQHMMESPFYRLSELNMQIRELAVSNKSLMEKVGVYVVDYTPPEAPTNKGIEQVKKKVEEKMGRNAEKEVDDKFEQLTGGSSQKDLVRSMNPIQRMQYVNQRENEIKDKLSMYKELIDKTRKEVESGAEM